MAWPPVYTTAFLAQGVTTIRWGTDGIMANTAPNGNGAGGFAGFYTVESLHGTDVIDKSYVEQGSGLNATRILLWQGRSYTLTVVDDTNMTPPAPGTLLSLADTISGGAVIYQFRVVENGDNTVRKDVHKREITAEYMTCIEGAGTPPVN